MLRCFGRIVPVRDVVTRLAATSWTLLAAAGCTSSHGSTTSPSLTGSLAVTIVAPDGVLPAVTVSSPDGFPKTLTATTTIVLLVGSYTVTAEGVTNADTIVNTLYTGTVVGSPAAVTANDTAKVSVTYTPLPGTGGLWVANSASLQTVVRYSAAQVASSTSVPPTTSLGTGDPRPFGVAFDPNGNLWVALSQGNLVVEYTASQLASSGTPTPAVTLGVIAGSLSEPAGLAFDLEGNLWVANGTGNTLVEFSAGQLASSGTPTPVVTIGASSGSLNAPLAIAFDTLSNLWVANANAGTVVEFIPAQLAAGGTPTPAVTLSAAAGSIVGPTGLAFDANGNLWVANGNTGHNTVVEFSASQLASSGAPTPPVVLSASAGSLASPTGLAFDNSGNLWVANAAAPSVVEFTISQLMSSGSPTPNVVLSGTSLAGPAGIAFDPDRLPVSPAFGAASLHRSREASPALQGHNALGRGTSPPQDLRR